MLVILFLLFQITSSCEVQQRSNDQDKPCQFPFIIRNTTYYGCTTALDSEGKLWCSTQTNDQSEHVANQKLWGYCTDPSCPNDNRIKNEALEAENNLQDIEINGRSGSVNCQCIYYRECPWSYQLMQNVANLPRFHLLRNRLITYVKDHICDQATQSVHCCQDQVDQQPSNESTPTITEVPKLTKNNPDMGTWQPQEGDCGEPSVPITNIVGGENTKPGEIPYMALLGYEISGDVYYLCGGSIINKWYVLTAAHCLLDKSGNPKIPKEIVLGEHIIGTNPDCNDFGCLPKAFTRQVQKYTLHESYNTSRIGGPYDLALIRLNQSVPMSNKIRYPNESGVVPVCIPWSANDPGRTLTTKADLLVTGWGRVTNNRRVNRQNYKRFHVATRTLKKLKVPAVSRKSCDQIDIFKNLNTDLQICAGGVVGEDSCNGDSGGPLVYRPTPDSPWYQVGIVSFGTSKCGVGQPGVYTRLSAFISWIQNHLEA